MSSGRSGTVGAAVAGAVWPECRLVASTAEWVCRPLIARGVGSWGWGSCRRQLMRSQRCDGAAAVYCMCAAGACVHMAE